MNDEIIDWDRSMLLEVEFDKHETFLSIMETLTRIGICNNKTKSLYQSVHILHKRGHYYLMHFKELYLLDGKHNNLTLEDIQRRNTIAKLLEEWGLLRISENNPVEKDTNSIFKVVKFSDKKNWNLISKYQVGK